MSIPADTQSSSGYALGEAPEKSRRRERSFRDLTRRRFGRLFVLERASGPVTKWVCECDCGTVKTVAARALVGGGTLSCGCLRRENNGGAKRRVPIAERFWTRVAKGDGCWLWAACKTDQGYGWINGYRELGETKAHRISWILTHGPIPGGLQVLHRCDTPACVRPDHLFLGTHVDNMRDMASKGRSASGVGSNNANSKLTEAEVLEIRNATGLLREIGDRYSVHLTTVKAIKGRLIWRHLP